ncbi:hypothetical protein CHUAL_004119 [Chamberlinius hualienensis]
MEDHEWRLEMLNRFRELAPGTNWPRHQAPTLVELPQNWISRELQQQQQSLQPQQQSQPHQQPPPPPAQALQLQQSQAPEPQQPPQPPQKPPQPPQQPLQAPHQSQLPPQQPLQAPHQSQLPPQMLNEVPQPPDAMAPHSPNKAVNEGVSTSILVPFVPVHIDPMGHTVRLPFTFHRTPQEQQMMINRPMMNQRPFRQLQSDHQPRQFNFQQSPNEAVFILPNQNIHQRFNRQDRPFIEQFPPIFHPNGPFPFRQQPGNRPFSGHNEQPLFKRQPQSQHQLQAVNPLQQPQAQPTQIKQQEVPQPQKQQEQQSLENQHGQQNNFPQQQINQQFSKFPQQNSQLSRFPTQDDQPPRFPPQNDQPPRFPTQDDQPPRFPPQNDQPPRFPPQNEQPPRFPPQNDQPPRFPPQNDQPPRFPPQNDQPPRFPPQNDQPPRFPPQNDQPPRFPPQNDQPPRFPPQNDQPPRFPPQEGPQKRFPKQQFPPIQDDNQQLKKFPEQNGHQQRFPQDGQEPPRFLQPNDQQRRFPQDGQEPPRFPPPNGQQPRFPQPNDQQQPLPPQIDDSGPQHRPPRPFSFPPELQQKQTPFPIPPEQQRFQPPFPPSNFNSVDGPNFDRNPNLAQSESSLSNFKNQMPLPEVTNSLPPLPPSPNQRPSGPPIFSIPPMPHPPGPPLRQPFNFPTRIPLPRLNMPHFPQPPSRDVKVPKIFGDFPTNPRFDKGPWIPITPLPKINRKPVASQSREALRVEKPPTEPLSTTQSSTSVVVSIGGNLPSTITPFEHSTIVAMPSTPQPVTRIDQRNAAGQNGMQQDANTDLERQFNQTLISNGLDTNGTTGMLDDQPIRARHLQQQKMYEIHNGPTSTPTNPIGSTLVLDIRLPPTTPLPYLSDHFAHFPTTQPTVSSEGQPMSAEVRQKSVEQLYNQWKLQFGQRQSDNSVVETPFITSTTTAIVITPKSVITEDLLTTTTTIFPAQENVSPTTRKAVLRRRKVLRKKIKPLSGSTQSPLTSSTSSTTNL